MSDTPASGIPIVSPLTGEVIELPDVPDPVFSSKVMGEGFGIKPLIGEVLAPAVARLCRFACLAWTPCRPRRFAQPAHGLAHPAVLCSLAERFTRRAGLCV